MGWAKGWAREWTVLQFDWIVLCTQQSLVDRQAGYGEARESSNADN